MATDPRRRPRPPPTPSPPKETSPDDEQNTPLSSLDGADDRPSSRPSSVQVGGANGQPPPPPPPASDQPSFKLKFCTVCASNNNRINQKASLSKESLLTHTLPSLRGDGANNSSMEAHLRLTTAPSPYPTISFGTGSLVRLPGPTISQPNVYSFNSTSYRAMYDELASKDPRLYRANGILPMLERNKGVKWGPERWQDWRVGVPRVGRRWQGPGDGSSGDTAAGAGGGGGAGGQEAEYKDDKGYAGTEAGTVDVVITCEERCWEAVVDDLLSRGAPLNRPVHVFNVDIKDNHEEALVGGRAILELADALNAAACRERDAWAQAGGAVNGFDSGHAAARSGFDECVPAILAEWQDRWPALPALWTLSWL